MQKRSVETSDKLRCRLRKTITSSSKTCRPISTIVRTVWTFRVSCLRASKKQFSAAAKCEMLAVSSHKTFYCCYFGLDWLLCKWTRSSVLQVIACRNIFQESCFFVQDFWDSSDCGSCVQGCKGVWRKLQKLHVSEHRVVVVPEIADGTRDSYDNCIRCVDGEHTRMNCASTYFCCKNCYSICLLAVTATNYKFIELYGGSFWTDSDAEAQWFSDARGE